MKALRSLIQGDRRDEASNGQPIPNFRNWDDFVTPRSIVMTIDPDSAEEILRDLNTKNRPSSPRNIVRFARDMSAGKWKLNGEAIVFAWTCRLMNGQNRLHACVKSGIPLVTFVTFGVDPETLDTIDQGKKRSIGDALGINGEKNCNNLAASIALLVTYESSEIKSTGFVRSKNITVAEAEEALARHPDLRESSSLIKSMHDPLWFLVPRVGTVCHYLFSRIDRVEAGRFFDDLASGAGLRDGDPVLLLRDRLMHDRKAKTDILLAEMLALVIKAWNFRRSGRVITKNMFRWRSTGPTAESLPRPF